MSPDRTSGLSAHESQNFGYFQKGEIYLLNGKTVNIHIFSVIFSVILVHLSELMVLMLFNIRKSLPIFDILRILV